MKQQVTNKHRHTPNGNEAHQLAQRGLSIGSTQVCQIQGAFSNSTSALIRACFRTLLMLLKLEKSINASRLARSQITTARSETSSVIRVTQLPQGLLNYSKCLAMKADQLILTQYPIVNACCLRAPQGSPSIPSDNVTELKEQVNKIMLLMN